MFHILYDTCRYNSMKLIGQRGYCLVCRSKWEKAEENHSLEAEVSKNSSLCDGSF
jgi:hypothetical protein